MDVNDFGLELAMDVEEFFVLRCDFLRFGSLLNSIGSLPTSKIFMLTGFSSLVRYMQLWFVSDLTSLQNSASSMMNGCIFRS